jgi:hypothetical protein
MSRRRLGAVVLAVLAAGAMVAGPIAAANASNIRIALDVQHALPGITRSQLRVKAALEHYSATRSPDRLIAAVRIQDRQLKRLRTRLRRDRASTPKGSRGRRDMLTGLSLILKSNFSINSDLRRHPILGLTKDEARATTRLARRGNADFRRGLRLVAHL